MLISCGKAILILDSNTGNELKKCEKHTEDVTCLAVRKDGLMFASGS